MTEQVTKPKSEGRVAAGKRLVEWNRKKKEDLIKSPQVPHKVSASSSASSSASQQEQPSQASGGFALLAIAAGVGVAIYFHGRKPAAQPPKNQDDDIFCMN